MTVGVSATMLYFLLYPESLEILTTGSSEAAMASFAFLSFHIGDIPWAVWPSFNVADSAICVGVGLFILSNFIRPEAEKEDAKKNIA